MQPRSATTHPAHTLLIALCGLLACVGNSRGDQPSVEAALATPLTTLDGRTVRITSLRGDQPVYVKFWATWCGTCLEELPHIKAAWRRHRDDIAIYYVNLGVNDPQEDVRAFAARHRLPMPTLIDHTGELADAFGVMGTPWHTLADESLVLHHNGTAEPAGIDERLAFLADPAKAAASTNRQPKPVSLPQTGAGEPQTGGDARPELHYYLATWCDWYLEERRPETAARCVRSQRMVNRLIARFPDLKVHGIASRLWTGADELADYLSRREVGHPVSIDSDNHAFLAQGIREIPTLLLLDNGRVVHRETEFDDYDGLEQRVRRALLTPSE